MITKIFCRHASRFVANIYGIHFIPSLQFFCGVSVALCARMLFSPFLGQFCDCPFLTLNFNDFQQISFYHFTDAHNSTKNYHFDLVLFLNERQFNPLTIPLITFEKFHNNEPKISNPPGDPEIRKIKLFTPKKNISILVMQKQDFLVGTSTSFPQRHTHTPHRTAPHRTHTTPHHTTPHHTTPHHTTPHHHLHYPAIKPIKSSQMKP